MVRAAQIENGKVINIIVANSLNEFTNLVDAGTASIGDIWDGQHFTPPPAPTPAPLTLADYDAALTAHLDAVAQTRRYADRVSCSVRAGYAGPFQAEGIAFAQWMDRQNKIAYQMLEDFMTGLIPQPTVEEFIASLDVMVWP